MSRARTRPKGKPTPSRRKREQSRREAMSPGDDILADFARALTNVKLNHAKSEPLKASEAIRSTADSGNYVPVPSIDNRRIRERDAYLATLKPRGMT